MITRSFAPFAGWVTQYRDKLRADPFLAVRIKIAALYFICGVFIYIIVDYFIDAGLKEAFYLAASLPPGEPIDEAFKALKLHLWSGRFLKLVLFAISAYILAGIAMRPIKRSAELQKRFIATVSHELRTPLAVAKNTSEVALRNEATLSREKAVGVVKSSLEEMDRISDIIQFLLTFSNLEHRKKSFTLEQISLAQVAEKTIELARKNFAHTHVHIRLRTEGPSLITGSATALDELLLNLVKNAVTYTPEGGEVTVSIHETDEHGVILRVADEGPGISEEDVPQLFEPFFQGKATPVHHTHGIGLGLAIVKSIAELHGATVEVARRESGGTLFTVSFPASVREA